MSISTHNFVTDEKIFGGIDPKAPSWNAWNTLFKGMDGEQLTMQECEIWRQITGQEYRAGKVWKNLLALCGRQAGKDVGCARLAIREAYCGGHEAHLIPGQKAYVLVISLNVRSNRVFLDYCRGFIHGSPLLEREVVEETKHEIHLRNGIVIAGYPCSHVSARGIRVCVFVMDEASFFRQEGVTTDVEVFRSVRPGMASFPNSRFFILSTPYMRGGLVYDFYKRYYAGDDDYLLVVQASTHTMNPTIAREFLEKEQEADPEAYLREYEAQFVDTLSSAFSRESVEECIVSGRRELPFREGCNYQAGTDPAGGGQDEFCLSICHREGEKVIQDCLRAYRSRRPADVVIDMAKVLKVYNLSKVTGDKNSGEWVRQAFQDQGISYEVAELTASEYFLELIPLVNQGNIELLDDSQQTRQLVMLERKKSRSGKESLGHPQGQHDDRANSLAISAMIEKGCGIPRFISAGRRKWTMTGGYV
jgi:hypothetical protein